MPPPPQVKPGAHARADEEPLGGSVCAAIALGGTDAVVAGESSTTAAEEAAGVPLMVARALSVGVCVDEPVAQKEGERVTARLYEASSEDVIEVDIQEEAADEKEGEKVAVSLGEPVFVIEEVWQAVPVSQVEMVGEPEWLCEA